MRIVRSWLLVALIAGVSGSCRGGDRDSRSERAEDPVNRIEDIRGWPLRYLDRNVTVIGKGDKVLDERAFELEGDGVLWPRKLLIMARAPVQFGPTKLTDGEELV